MQETMTATPEERMDTYLQELGWKGGTIHQVAQETGCNVGDLLYTTGDTSQDYWGGWFAARTCTHEHRRTLHAKNHGIAQWWIGLADGARSLLLFAPIA